MKHRPEMPSFRAAQHGFTGAEKALLICFSLAIIILVGALISGGGQRAGSDAERTLAQGTAALGSATHLGQMMSPSGLPRAGGIDALAAAQPRPAPVAPASLPQGQADTAYDGAFVGAGGKAYPGNTPIDRIPPVLPSDGRKPNETLVYVNGINTDKAGQFASLQDIANHTGAQVIGIHNSTSGTFKDLAQSLGDKADVGKNPAVDQLTDTIYNSIQQGKPIHILAHSQGGLITSRALDHVIDRLRIEDGLSKADAQKRLGLVQVETFGAAAVTYPDGPQYVHYVNRGDLVPVLFGLDATRLGNLGAGKGAKVIRFNEFHWNPIAAHSFDDVYLPRRLPFGQARK